MKVMTIVGTRPELIKLSRVIPALDSAVDHVLVHTGQNNHPALSDNIFKDLGIRAPDVQHPPLGAVPAVHGTALLLSSVDVEFERHKPDAVLILGDTNSCVAAAYAAKRRKVPLFHMEAGNRCFDERTPEEVNRRIVDHISDINMPYTEHARRNLLAEGISADRVIKTGSPTREVIRHYLEQIEARNILMRYNLQPGEYFVVSAHREENVDDPYRLEILVSTVNQLALQAPTVVSIHPRTAARLRGTGMFDQRVIVHEPFGFLDYACLQMRARCVISDSGTLAEEAAIMGFPAVTIRQAHERPEAIEGGTMVMSDIDFTSVDQAIKVVDNTGYVPADYADGNVSRKVVQAIVSYTDYVNRTVWRKS